MKRYNDEVLRALSKDQADGSVFVFVDETYSPRVAVGAVVVESNHVQRLDSDIAGLLAKLRSQHHLVGTSSYRNFVKHGFHASGDPLEVGVAFVAFLSETTDFKSMIVFSDGTLANRMTSNRILAVAAYVLVNDVIRAYRSRPRIIFCFESNAVMDKYLERIVERAAHNLKKRRPVVEVYFGSKQQPHLLAIPDYVLHIFNRWFDKQEGPTVSMDPTTSESRRFKAVLGSISMARGLESNRVIRRTLDANTLL